MQYERCPFLTIDVHQFRTETMVMTLAATGAYVTLMVHALYRDGMIAGDEATLRRIVRASPRVWRQIRDQILPHLEPVEGGYRIHHAVASAERHQAIVKSARMGGLAKQQKALKAAQLALIAGPPSTPPNHLKTNGPDMPSPMPSEGLNDHSTPANGNKFCSNNAADGRDRDEWEGDLPF